QRSLVASDKLRGRHTCPQIGLECREPGITIPWRTQVRQGSRSHMRRPQAKGERRVPDASATPGCICRSRSRPTTKLAPRREPAVRRGRWSYADIFFPMTLLNWGHYHTTCCLGLLLTIVRFGTQVNGWASISSGVAVAALPLCGVPGLAYVPGLALWLAEVGRQKWRAGSTTGRRDALIVWVLVAVAVFLIPIYFIDLKTTVQAPFQLLRTLWTMVAFVAHGLGPAAPALQPWSYALVLSVFLFAAAVLVRALRERDVSTRSRGFAMLMFLLAFSGLAFAVGVARPGTKFPPRYFLFAV